MLTTTAGVQILPGDFAVTKMAGPLGPFIRLGEALNGEGFRDYEHAFMYVGGDTDLILEAEPGGARLVPFHYEPRTCLWSSGIPSLAIAVPTGRIQTVAARYKGVPYSFLDYAALVAHRLDVPVPGLRRYIGTTRHMICSQLVDQFRLDLGSHLFDDGRWPGYVTPASLANLIESAMP